MGGHTVTIPKQLAIDSSMLSERCSAGQGGTKILYKSVVSYLFRDEFGAAPTKSMPNGSQRRLHCWMLRNHKIWGAMVADGN